MDYSIYGSGQLLEVRVSGEITRSEIHECWRGLEACENYAGAVAGLVVFERHPSWRLTGEEITTVAREVVRLRPLKWALVCNDLLSFGMCRMFSAFAEGEGTYDVFSTEETARDWLRVAGVQGS